jgi:hypothetical protein
MLLPRSRQTAQEIGGTDMELANFAIVLFHVLWLEKVASAA